MKKSFLLIPALFLLLLSGCCSTMVKNSIKDEPINNRMMLPGSLEKGDRAVYEILVAGETADPAMGTTSLEVRVVDVTRGEHVVSYKTKNTGMLAMAGNYEIELTTDKNGNVQQGFFIENGNRTALTVAVAGDKNYNNYKEYTPEEISEIDAPTEISTPAGTFNCTAYHYYDSNRPKERFIYYYSDEVKFGHVATYMAENKRGSWVFTPMMVLQDQN